MLGGGSSTSASPSCSQNVIPLCVCRTGLACVWTQCHAAPDTVLQPNGRPVPQAQHREAGCQPHVGGSDYLMKQLNQRGFCNRKGRTWCTASACLRELAGSTKKAPACFRPPPLVRPLEVGAGAQVARQRERQELHKTNELTEAGPETGSPCV